jgi:hypothetical protein
VARIVGRELGGSAGLGEELIGGRLVAGMSLDLGQLLNVRLWGSRLGRRSGGADSTGSSDLLDCFRLFISFQHQ